MYKKVEHKLKPGPKPSERSKRRMYYIRVSENLHANLLELNKDFVRMILETHATKENNAAYQIKTLTIHALGVGHK